MDQNFCLCHEVTRNKSAADTIKGFQQRSTSEKSSKLNTQGQISDVPILRAHGNKYSLYDLMTTIKCAILSALCVLNPTCFPFAVF